MNLFGLIKRFSGSMVGYLPIKIMEGIIGILTIRVYTYLFIPEVYGSYTMINYSVIIVFMLSLNWIVQGVIRFSNAFIKDANENKQFISTIFVAGILIIIVEALIFFGGNLIFPSIFKNVSHQVLMVAIFVLIGYSMNQILLTYLLYSDKRLLNAVLLLGAAAAKLVITVILVKIIGNTIISLFISQSVTDIIVGLIALFTSSMHKNISIKAFSGKMLKFIMAYGYPLMGLSLTMVILNISDRYIIDFFYSKKEVGLYTPNYAISSSIFTMIMVGLSRGIYPKILQAWNNNKKEEAEKSLALGGKYYIIIGLPAAIGLYLLSTPISSLFVDSHYFAGRKVIGLVAIGMFFLGLAEYYNKGWELNKNTIPILKNCIIAAVFNIALNIIFIPKIGYIFAAYSTAISYFIYLILSMIRGNKEIPFILPKKSLVNILISTFIMAIIVITFDYFVYINLIGIIIVIPLATAGYFISLFITGEIRQEIMNLR